MHDLLTSSQTKTKPPSQPEIPIRMDPSPNSIIFYLFYFPSQALFPSAAHVDHGAVCTLCAGRGRGQVPRTLPAGSCSVWVGGSGVGPTPLRCLAVCSQTARRSCWRVQFFFLLCPQEVSLGAESLRTCPDT